MDCSHFLSASSLDECVGKKDSSLLISLSLSNSPAPSPYLSPSLLFFFFDSVSLRCEDRVSVLRSGWGGASPWRIQSGLQSCDDCSRECNHLTSLAPFFLFLTAPDLATVAGEIL